MSGWNYIVIILSVVMLALLLVREVRRENRARLLWRIIATILMVAALAVMVLPIGYSRSTWAGNKEGVLLTEGYIKDSIRVRGPVWKNPEDIDINAQGVSKLHVYGYGLTRDACVQLPQVPLVFHPSPMSMGVVSIHWKSSLWPGEMCRVQGRFYPPTGAAVKLLLTGMHTVLDSTELKSREGGDFELRTVPAQAGRAVYRLIALSGRDTLEQEAIPVEVLPGKNLKILMLAAAPDFENRFLANWLSDKGHGVAIRTAISKEKYDHAYLNIAAASTDHLSSSLLDKFDVVIADAAELKAMGSGDYTILRRQVAEKRLGLIIKADSTSLGHGVRSVGGSDSVLRMVIADKPGDRPIIKDTLSRTLVSANMYGGGKIILTTLYATYARLLAGNKKEYASLWTSILQQAAGNDDAGERWHLRPALPVVDEPVGALLQSAGGGLPQGLFEDEGAVPVVAYMAQSSLLPFAWEGRYWPRVAGWQTVRTLQGDRTWWYVWGKEDWRSLRRMERVRAMEEWIAGRGEDRRGTGRGKDAGEEKVRGKEKVGRERDKGGDGEMDGTGDVGGKKSGGRNGGMDEADNVGNEEMDGTDKIGKRVEGGRWFCLILVLSMLFLWVERKI